MSTFPWYRFYSEALIDRKMLRICRDSGQPKALVIGVWATLLALASESPERGSLAIAAGIYLTADEIRDETGLDKSTFDALIARFTAYGLVDTVGECWSICNWDKRQFGGDSSSERVRRHRQKKDTAETLQAAPEGTLMKRSGNVSETVMKRSGNVIDTDTEADPETEREGSASAPTPAPDPFPFQPVPESLKRAKAKRGDPAPPADVPAAPPALVLLHRLTSYWPGDDNAGYLIGRLGGEPDERALARAVELWRAAGYKKNNWIGICDFYDEICRDPGWHPGAKFKQPAAKAPVPPATEGYVY